MSNNDLLKSLQTAFVDQRIESDEALRARLVVNEESEGRSVLNEIEASLQTCEEFAISVAFVTLSGLTPLLMTLSELMQPRPDGKRVRGRILTTDYLTFTEPAALKRLADFPNIEVRMFCTNDLDQSAAGFHTKGYIFRSGTQFRFIVGSSNLTAAALKSNHEWNVKLVAHDKGEITRRVLEEFEALWNHRCTHPVDKIIDDYSERYFKQQDVRAKIAAAAVGEESAAGLLRPNLMQTQLITKITDFMKLGEEAEADRNGQCARRALLISATGTGKTFASAFAVRSLGPRRVLFLVHREQIARKSQKSYRAVLGESYKYGFFIAQDHSALEIMEGNCAVFSTMQSMVNALDEGHFAKDAFDVIVIDEVHRAGAASYKKIMAYFEPRLWLGMTATPDRPDTENIYALFDHQILLDLRLQQALEQNLLCPFHYFGISEFVAGDVRYDDPADFARLTSEQRVRHILENTRRYGFSGPRVKGLIFCGTNKEADELSEKFNAQGLHTLALSGADSQQQRERAIGRLTTNAQSFQGETPLDYILTVDIFNEGVDIPEVNQVVLLRQTQSPIVFVQQLGRGLRKSPDKDFVVVLDFIGNYDNNYMIPVALSGDRSYQKDGMRKVIVAGLIPGDSTVHFDAVARERIFQAIDRARTDSWELLRNAYRLLKYQLGRVPSLRDFDEHGSIDAVKFFSKADSYVEFLYKVEKERKENGKNVPNPDRPNVSALGREMLRYLSLRIGAGLRPSEALVIEEILKEVRTGLKTRLAETLASDTYGLSTGEEHLENCFKVLTNNFARNQSERKKFEHAVFIEKDDEGDWRAAAAFVAALEAHDDFRHHLADLVAFVKDRYLKRYSARYRDTAFKLYERYTYDDVCRLLNWKSNMPATNIGGYRYDSDTRTLPVFINYDKAEGDINYHDHFESPREIIALSKTNRSTKSSDADHIYKRTERDRDNRIYLFVRKNKNDNEAKSFYFLGEVSAQDDPTPIKIDADRPAFEIRYRLDEPVRTDIYTYLTH